VVAVLLVLMSGVSQLSVYQNPQFVLQMHSVDLMMEFMRDMVIAQIVGQTLMVRRGVIVILTLVAQLVTDVLIQRKVMMFVCQDKYI